MDEASPLSGLFQHLDMCQEPRSAKEVPRTLDVFMEVTAAYTCPLDSDEHLAGTWLWFGHIIKTDVFLAVESCSSHSHCGLFAALDKLIGISRVSWIAM